MEKRNRSLTTLSFAHYFNDMYSMILPGLIPILILIFDLSYFQAGIAAMLFIAIPAVLKPLLGHTGDVGKGKQFLVGGLLLVSICAAFFGMAPNYMTFLILCGIAGVGLAAYHPLATYFLSTDFKEKKGKAMGVHGAGGSLGHFSGPTLITFLAATIIGWKLGLVLLVLPTICIATLCWITLHSSDLQPMSNLKFTSSSIKTVLTPSIIILSVVLALRTAVYRGLVTFLPSFFVEEGTSLLYSGILTGTMLIAGVLAQPLGGLVSDHFGRKLIIFLSLLALSPLVLIFGFLVTLSQLFLVISLFLIGFCIFASFPVGLAFAAELGEKNVGLTVGIVSAIYMGVPAVVPPIIGFIIDTFGFFVAFYVLGGLSLMGAMIAILLPKK